MKKCIEVKLKLWGKKTYEMLLKHSNIWLSSKLILYLTQANIVSSDKTYLGLTELKLHIFKWNVIRNLSLKLGEYWRQIFILHLFLFNILFDTPKTILI